MGIGVHRPVVHRQVVLADRHMDLEQQTPLASCAAFNLPTTAAWLSSQPSIQAGIRAAPFTFI